MSNSNKRKIIDKLIAALNAEKIAYNPEMAKMLGDPNQAILFQQLQFWCDKGKRNDCYIYKTKETIKNETGLTEYQQDTARSKLENEHGVIETKLMKANGAPTIHYKVNIPQLRSLVMEYLENQDSMESRQYQDSNPEDVGKPLTENTTENTTENKHKATKSETSQPTNSSSSQDHPNPDVELETEAEKYDPFSGERIPDNAGEINPVSENDKRQEKIERIWEEFADQCDGYLNTRPTKDRKSLIQIRRALCTHDLSEDDIYDLFDDWFRDEKKTDEQLIHITYALSNDYIDEFKARYGI